VLFSLSRVIYVPLPLSHIEDEGEASIEKAVCKSGLWMKMEEELRKMSSVFSEKDEGLGFTMFHDEGWSMVFD